MTTQYIVRKGDTLNKIAQSMGFANYKEAGISSVPSGNFNLIRPGETITIGNAKPTAPTTTAPVVTPPATNTVNYGGTTNTYNPQTGMYSSGINASQVTPAPTYTPPQGIANANAPTSALDLTAGTSGLQAQQQAILQQQQAALNASLEKERTTQAAADKAMADKTTYEAGRTSAADLWNTANSQLKIGEQNQMILDTLPVMTSLRDQLQKLKNDEAQAVENLKGQGRGIPLGVLGAQESKILRTYAIRENAVSGQLANLNANVELLRGNIAGAQASAKIAIDAYLYDTAQKVQDYKDLYTYNSDIISKLDAEQKGILDRQYQAVQNELATKRTEQLQVLEWKMKYPTANINIGDSLQDASSKASQVAGTGQDADYQKALAFVKANPNASPSELEQYIRAYTKGLSEGDIKSLIGSGTKLTRENIATLYGISDDETKYGGFLGIGGTTGKSKLDEIMKMITSYQAVGYDDDAILKLIKG